ncbi:MAG: PilZ domain-containing protein [Novosphingobium sp.]
MKHETFPDGAGCNRYGKDRETVTLQCEVRQGTRPWKSVLLEDISRFGFRVAWVPGFHTDTPLRIRISGMQVLTAYIRWKKGETLGCEFGSPLHIAVFDHILREAQQS